MNYEKSHEEVPSLLSANVCSNLSLCTTELSKIVKGMMKKNKQTNKSKWHNVNKRKRIDS